MTSINKLTQNKVFNSDDLVPIWDQTNNRTRSVSAETIKEFTAVDEVVNAKIVNDHLILIKEDGSEIDCGELPSHTGVNISDNGVDKGNYTRINFSHGNRITTDGVTVNVESDMEYQELDNALGDLNYSLDGSTFYLLTLGDFSGVWNSIDPSAEIKGGPTHPDGPFDVIDGNIPVEFKQWTDRAATPPITHQQIKFFQGERKTTYTRAGIDSVGSIHGIGNSDWAPIDTVSVSRKDGRQEDFTPARFIELGSGLNSVFDGDKARVFSDALFSDPITVYGAEDDFPGGVRVWNESETGQTYFYLSEGSRDDKVVFGEFKKYDGWSFIASVKNGSKSSLNIELDGKQYPCPVGGIRFIWYSDIHGVETELIGEFLNFIQDPEDISKFIGFDNPGWGDLPVGKHFTVPLMFINIDPLINEEVGQLYIECNNTNIATETPDDIRLIIHKYRVVAPDNPKIHNLQFSRSGKTGEDFIKQPWERTGQTPIDPSDGFELKDGAEIGVNDGSAIHLKQGGDFFFDFNNGTHNLIQTDSDGIVIGSNQVDADIELRTKFGKIKAQTGGSNRFVAFEDNTIEEILAGEGITVTGNPRTPKITATAGGGGADPSEGFTLKPNTQIRFDPTSKMMLQHDGGTHTLLDFSYEGGQDIYYTQFGDISTEFQIKTKSRPSISEDVGGFWTVAYDEENHIPNVEWERSTQARELLAEELYQYIDFIFEPFGEGHVAHLVMPERSTWESKFWIPSVNDAKQYHLPSIEHWRMSFTMPKDNIATTENHRLRLTSKDGLTNFDQDGTDVITAIKGKRWVAFWAKPKESSPDGWQGWVLKFSPDDEDDFIPFTTYEAQGEVAYTGKPINQNTRIVDGIGYTAIDRQSPVTTTGETDNLQLIRVIGAETGDELPEVETVATGELASGFSVCEDATPELTQILQASSGTYTLTQMTFAQGASIGDGVYVDADGKLTLTPSDYQAGWVIADGVIIDIDLYNMSIIGDGTDDNPVFKSVSIDTLGSGQPNFSAVIHQDTELHTVIDATKELRVKTKSIADGSLNSVLGINNSQAQFLVPIYQGNDAVALKKDVPNKDNFILKHTNAELNKLFCAYQGKYNDNRAFYPVSLYQDVNGWTQFEFTANMQFKSKNKDSGSVGDKVLEVKQSKVVAHKDFEVLGNTIYDGDTSQPTNIINRKALDDEPQKEWFTVANGTLTTDGDRPTGDSGVEGELAVWHNVTSDSTTDPANELKVLFDGAYDKIDEFSKPLRFRLSQQSGSRNQYWAVDDNGWQTNGNVYHLSASKVTGDNLIVGIDTKVYASAYFAEDFSTEIDEKIAADKAKGEWIGGVYKDTINDDGNPSDDFTCDNPKHWLEYRKTTFQGDYALNVIQGSTPISSEIVIHLHPSSGMASTQFRVVTNDGKESIKTVRTGEKWRFFLRKGTWPYYERIDDGTSGYVMEDDLTYAIEENNDEIITPSKGDQFQLIDSEKSTSYGNSNKQVTYFAPSVGTQSSMLLTHLGYGKAWAIHEQVNSTKLIMILHESLVAEIYNKDLTGVNELTMLFTGDSRGRLGKANQTADPQFAINWNGELIPATENANELNPTQWIAPDDSVTETWSNSVKSVCYSTGVLANRGSAMLKRGDVVYSKPESVTHTNEALKEQPRHLSNSLADSGETATITYDNSSEFFVMPIFAGGGTFNVMKVFQLFMSRKYQSIDEWGSFRFEQSSDCIGTILKIAYDAAIAEEEKEIETQNDELLEGLASGFIYAKSVSVG